MRQRDQIRALNWFKLAKSRKEGSKCSLAQILKVVSSKPDKTPQIEDAFTKHLTHFAFLTSTRLFTFAKPFILRVDLVGLR